MATGTHRIEWSITPADSRVLRLLSYCSFGVIFGMPVFAVFVSAMLVLDGNPIPSGALAVALLLAVFRWETHVRPLFASTDGPWSLDRRWLFVSSLFGVGVVYLTLGFGNLVTFVSLFSLIAVPMVLVSAVRSEGEIDAVAQTMTYRDRDVPLDGLANVRRFALLGVTVHWLSYVAGASNVSTPRFVVLPESAATEAASVFSAAVEADSPEYDRPDSAVRYALVAFGVFFLAFAVFVAFAVSGNPDATAVEAYALLVFGFMGFGFLGAAAVLG